MDLKNGVTSEGTLPFPITLSVDNGTGRGGRFTVRGPQLLWSPTDEIIAGAGGTEFHMVGIATAHCFRASEPERVFISPRATPAKGLRRDIYKEEYKQTRPQSSLGYSAPSFYVGQITPLRLVTTFESTGPKTGGK